MYIICPKHEFFRKSDQNSAAPQGLRRPLHGSSLNKSLKNWLTSPLGSLFYTLMRRQREREREREREVEDVRAVNVARRRREFLVSEDTKRNREGGGVLYGT